MARGLAVATLLLVTVAAMAQPFFAHAAGYAADAPAKSEESPADAPAESAESPSGKADAPAADSDSPVAAPNAAAESPDDAPAADDAESPAGKADAPTEAAESPDGTDGLTYVNFVIKNPVASKEDARADGLPIDPTPDGQMQ